MEAEPILGKIAACPLIPAACGFERLDGGSKLTRHRHSRGYIAVVIDGGYQEDGDAGRFSVRSGDALLHLPFEAHRDETARSGAKILNLPHMAMTTNQCGFRIDDIDALVATARRDLVEAAIMFADAAMPRDLARRDWPDLLADRLRNLSPFKLGDWAHQHGLAAESVSRGFAKAFGVTPHRYRAEARARQAVEQISTSDRRLIDISADLGFSDQAHMSRMVSGLTGHTPSRWRRSR